MRSVAKRSNWRGWLVVAAAFLCFPLLMGAQPVARLFVSDTNTTSQIVTCRESVDVAGLDREYGLTRR